MKKIIFLLFLSVCFQIRCSKSDDPGNDASLKLSATKLTVIGTAGNTSVNVVSNSPWSITSSESWLTVSPTSGSGNGSIKITIEKNLTGASRAGTLTIVAASLPSQTVAITQDVAYDLIYGVLSPKDDFKGAIVTIDPNTGKTLQSISIKADPNYEEGLAYDGNLLYYINGRTDVTGINRIVRFDPAAGVAVDTFSTVFPERMDALAINHKNLYVLDFLQKKIYVVDTDNQKITDTIAPGFSEPAIGGLTFGGSRGTLFISSFTFGDASTYKVFEINAATGAVVNSFAVPVSAFGLAYSENAHVLYITTGEPFDSQKSIYVLNPDTGAILKKFTGSASALAADESGL
jgi:outer membrane protein assembly factor BamB